MNKGLILIVVGVLISFTIYGVIIGVPLIFIGAYLMNKDIKNAEQGLSDNLVSKKEELNNIEETLKKKEKESREKLDKELKEKQDELDNIDEKLDQLEKERIAKVDEELANRETDLDKRIAEKEDELNNLDEEYQKKLQEKEDYLKKELQRTESDLTEEKLKLKKVREELVLAEDDVEMQEYGLYEPKYNFVNATAYKERLDAVRKQQKQMIKDKTAAIGATEWTIDGSKSKGKAFINANIKQILRSFNNETEVTIGKVKHSNLESSKKRIQKSFDVLNNLYKREQVHLTQGYLNLKFDEMHLAYEYEVKKQEEKEELREAREREREEKKL